MCMATRVLSASLTFGFLVALHPAVSWADRYADAVVAFSPVIKSGQPTAPHLGSTNSLGAPDYNGVTSCGSEATCTFVSLGDGGSITLRFVDNALTGSDGGDPDIWIYEVGPDVEDICRDQHRRHYMAFGGVGLRIDLDDRHRRGGSAELDSHSGPTDELGGHQGSILSRMAGKGRRLRQREYLGTASA
jgi:hypothetical protein